ncbi:hypothetical protein [uncultured Capnocytophaga sp.]|nr:hypothetical protein [uncultured Capnocytophaga sp.]
MRAAQASHTRLRQLADFPSLILRSTFAQPSLKVRLKKGRDDAVSKEVKK